MNAKLNFGPYYEQISNWILTQTNASRYFAILSILLVGIMLVLIFFSGRLKYSRILFIICSIATFFIFRGLSLYSDSLNPDEGHHLANAIALSHNGRLWVATDTTTFGPVSAVIILIVHKIISIFFPTFGITYFLLRLVNIILISVSFVLLFKIFESRLNKKIAWIISLFFTMFLSLFWNPDLQAFNSEYVFLLFISISLYATYKFKYKANMFPLIIGALTSGTMPFIKLQTIPMCVVLILWNIYLILRKENILLGKKRFKNHYIILVYILMIILPSLFIFIYCLTYTRGIKNAFFYFFQNASDHIGRHTLNQYIDYFKSKLFPWLLNNTWWDSISIIILLAFIISLIIIIIKKFKVKIDSNYFFSCMLLLFSVGAVTVPMSLITHYIIFLVVPALLFFMETVVLLFYAEYKWINLPNFYIPKTILQKFKKENVITFCLALLILALFASFPMNVLKQTVLSNKVIEYANSYHEQIIGYTNPYLTQAALYITEHTTYDDYVVVWGWEQRIFVYANRKSGTAQTDIQRLYPPYSSKNVYLYVSDIHKNRPKIIIDVVAPYSFGFNNNEVYGLEKHAHVWAEIRNDYSLTDTLTAPDGKQYRVYSRNKGSQNGKHIGEITENVVIKQTFLSNDNNLCAIQILFATFIRTNTSTIDLQLYDENNVLINEETIQSASILDNSYLRYKFAHINDSLGKKYTLVISSKDAVPGNAVTIWCTNGDSFEGNLFINGQQQTDNLCIQLEYIKQ